METAGPQVNLSEVLRRAPGVVARDRQNYAQDLQISVRGFGARSTFGVRGVRLEADGIPASMPDGQGQAATLDLGSAARIEVLRGPLAVLHGNAAGGVIRAITEDGPEAFAAEARASAGRFNARRFALKAGGAGGLAHWSRFQTDGYREHSATRRTQFNGKQNLAPGGSLLTLIINGLDQEAQDPLGLRRADLDEPREADAAATAFDTRKSVTHRQAGATLDTGLGAGELRLTAYGGTRDLVQFLAVPVAAQQGPAGAGGVVDLDRRFGGAGLHYTQREGALVWAVGAEIEHMGERRRGFENFVGQTLGVRGHLRRDEDDWVTSLGLYARGEWQPTRDWTWLGGVRASRVRFEADDFYVRPGNPDDSGGVDYSALSPALGVVFRARPGLQFHASAGRGFETPTFTELAYRREGSGLNTGLAASRNRQFELGLEVGDKGGAQLQLNLFTVDTDNELAVLANQGGRAMFQNAGRTRRRGMELTIEAPLSRGLRAYAALTALDARYARPFLSCAGTPCVTPNAPVAADNRLPGIPAAILFAELEWRAGPWSAALEAEASDRVFVNDLNNDAAAGYALAHARAGWAKPFGPWRIQAFVRADNLFDRDYVGSIIVNEANGRAFEPGPGRAWLAGASLSYGF